MIESPETPRPRWQLECRTVGTGDDARMLRLVRFATGWLASTDTESGPTIGMDRSPYLAARRALEPIGIGLVEAMTTVGPMRD